MTTLKQVVQSSSVWCRISWYPSAEQKESQKIFRFNCVDKALKQGFYGMVCNISTVYKTIISYGDVARSVGRLICNQYVWSSNPSTSSNGAVSLIGKAAVC